MQQEIDYRTLLNYRLIKHPSIYGHALSTENRVQFRRIHFSVIIDAE